jgi:hypothetical protein
MARESMLRYYKEDLQEMLTSQKSFNAVFRTAWMLHCDYPTTKYEVLQIAQEVCDERKIPHRIMVPGNQRVILQSAVFMLDVKKPEKTIKSTPTNVWSSMKYTHV